MAAHPDVSSTRPSHFGLTAVHVGGMNPGGRIPTTVTGVALELTDRPRIPASPPNRCCQVSWLRSATRRCASASSLVKSRPAIGWTWSTRNRLAETPLSASGVSSGAGRAVAGIPATAIPVIVIRRWRASNATRDGKLP
jgi:hypothetical protein